MTGFQLLREKLIATAPRPDRRSRSSRRFHREGRLPEHRTDVAALPRNPKNLDDIIPTLSHIYDAIRYALEADRTPRISTHRRYYA